MKNFLKILIYYGCWATLGSILALNNIYTNKLSFWVILIVVMIIEHINKWYK